MNFLNAIKSGFKQYVGFSGRASRAEFWWWHLFTVIPGILYSIFYVYLLQSIMPSDLTMPEAELNAHINQALQDSPLFPVFLIAMGLMTLFSLATFLPNLAISVRRFHDQNRSGWFFLLGFIPLLGPLILYVFFVLPGTQGSNRFGAQPN